MNHIHLAASPKAGRHQGFTLIELIITIAIVGILASIALPSYDKYVIKGRRAAAQSAMLDIANLEQQYFLAGRAYAAALSTLNYGTPSDVSTKYTASVNTSQILDSTCALVADTTVPSYVVAMTPIVGGSQVSDGTLYLSSTGVKCPSGKW